MMTKNKKVQKSSTKGGRGRKSLSSAENLRLEERIEFVAGLIASLRVRGEIVKACAYRYKVCAEMADRYIAEVRRRWREKNDSSAIIEKKIELVETLKNVARKAEERVTYGSDGKPHPNPDWWLVRQIIIDIAKVEGVFESASIRENGELDQILQELSVERSVKQKEINI